MAHHHGALSAGEEAVGSGVLLWFGEVSDFDGVLTRIGELGATLAKPVHRNPPEGGGPSHLEVWIRDPDGYTVVVASPDGADYGAPDRRCRSRV